ncbi:MAG: beta-lactamase family protein [Proteobacteria bacterium]|nr:beta-lactamase family protein [Pseudomonadota bacterium]
MRACIAVGLSALLAACQSAAPAKDADAAPSPAAATTRVDPAHLDAVLRGRVTDGKSVGVSALVYENGREAYFGAFGDADREAGHPMARDTIVQVYSMTKAITGVVLMTLYEEGRFQLDDPLSKHLPEYADMRVYAGTDADGQPRYEAPSRPISVYDILRHTAGFAADNDQTPVGRLLAEARPVDPGHTLAEFSERLARVPLVAQPGTRWIYGPSVDVQARLAEKLAGKPFAQLMRERVLDPLGMHDTSYLVPEAKRARMAAIYKWADGAFTRGRTDEFPTLNTVPWTFTPGGFGLASTLDDYMRFARMLVGGGAVDGVRILEPATVALMATDALPQQVTDSSWLPGKGQVGFGIDFAVRHSPPADAEEASGAVGEFFWDGYANTLFWIDPRNDIAAVLFTQDVPPGSTGLHKAFRDAVYVHDAAASAAGKPPRAR